MPVVATTVLGLLTTVGSAYALNIFPRQTSNDSAPLFDWTSVKATIDLKALQPCFDNFQCGRLDVPLDYGRQSADAPRASIAVTILPATDKANYKGSILLNPGGPGGAGTQAVVGLGSLLSQIVGPSYDLVGFDPRGTGATIPSAMCFEPAAWAAFANTDRLVLKTKEDVAYALAHDEAVAAKCFETMGEGGRYVDTGAVANDLLSIVRALGQEKLNYIGVSYGTVLGQYFAAMHPDKVGLMLIDGVTDAVTWRNADVIHDLEDTDNVVDTFFDLCTKAGASVCPVAAKTKCATKKRVEKIFQTLQERPIAVVPHANGVSVVTADNLRLFLRTRLYEPSSGFPVIAEVLAAVETRNTTALAEFGANDPISGLPLWFTTDQALQAISCTDFPDLSKTSLNEAYATLRNATRTSQWAGSIMARIKLECITWKMRAAAPYTGPLESQTISGKLLVSSNFYDPITPLADARAVQKRFANSALLVQNTIGHCALLTAGSCVAQTIGAFFQAGVLPENGTVCEPDELPLVGAVTTGVKPGLHI